MLDAQSMFREYAGYHQSRLNRAAHWLGLPLIVVAGASFAGRFGALLIVVFWLALALVHLVVEVRLAVVLAVVLAPLCVVGALIPEPLAAWVLVVGVACPVATHVFVERRWPDTPAKLLRFELVGMLWFLNRVVRVVDDR